MKVVYKYLYFIFRAFYNVRIHFGTFFLIKEFIMSQNEKYIFEANRFADIETLSEVYNQYYAYVAMSDLTLESKKKYLDYILAKQKE